MFDKANPHYVSHAKALIGKRAFLMGGGMPMNELILCTVKSVSDDGHATVEAGDYQAEFSPFLCSWRIAQIADWVLPQIGDLPNGHYYRSIAGATALFRTKGVCSAEVTLYKELKPPVSA